MVTEENQTSAEEGANVSTETTTNTVATEANNDNVTPKSNGTKTEETQAFVEPDEDSIKKFFASKGRNVESLDDLFVEKVKEVNPYADVNDELKQILAYSKETGRGVSDYFKLQENIDEKPLVDIAIAKAAKEAGGSFSKEDLSAYLEDALGIDLSGELTPAETVKLTKYVKDYKEEFKAEQEKYRTPLPKNDVAEQNEMIVLPDGQKVDKKTYEAYSKERQAYLDDVKVAVDSVATTNLQIEFDNNGTKETRAYGYEFDTTDKQDMLSKVQDLDATVSKLFKTEKGFDHQGFAESTWFLDKVNREKWAAALINKARAEAIIESTKAENNVNFTTNSLPTREVKEGVKVVPVKELFNL